MALTIAGETGLPNALVRVQVGSVGGSTTAADASGRFVATTAAETADDVVAIIAEGDPLRGQGQVAVASLVDTFGRLVAASNSDRFVDEQAHPGLRLSVWSTARYAWMRHVAGGLPTSAAALDDAELSQAAAPFQPSNEIAFYHRFLVGAPLPSGIDSLLDLANDVPRWRELADDWFRADEEAVRAAVRALVATRTQFSSFGLEDLGRFYSGLTIENDGVLCAYSIHGVGPISRAKCPVATL